MKTPLAYANQFYVLREHIRFVRERLMKSVQRFETQFNSLRRQHRTQQLSEFRHFVYLAITPLKP
jgi:hypothetical protein